MDGSTGRGQNYVAPGIISILLFLIGMSQTYLEQEMGLSSHTTVDWYNFHRELCLEIMLEKAEPIGGLTKRVQIDESKFGKRKYNRGRRREGQWVLGGIEEDSRRSFLVPVDKRDRATLLPIIKK